MFHALLLCASEWLRNLPVYRDRLNESIGCFACV